MPIFEVNGKRYDVAEEYIEDFAKEFPNAYTTQEYNGNKLNVKVGDYQSFLNALNESPIEEPTDSTYKVAQGRFGALVDEETPEEKAARELKAQERRRRRKDGINSVFAATMPGMVSNEYVQSQMKTDVPAEPTEEQKKAAEDERLFKQHLEDSGQIQELYDLREYARENDGSNGIWDYVNPLGEKAPIGGAIHLLRSAFSEDYRDKKQAQKRNRLIAEQADKAIDVYEQATGDRNGISSVFNAVADEASRISTWDLGMTDLQNAATLYELSQKDESELTASEKATLDAIGLASSVMSLYGDEVGMGYKIGQGVPATLSFMGSMALNPAAGYGKKLAGDAVKKFGKDYVKRVAKRAAGDILETGAYVGSVALPQVAANTLDRINGSTTYDLDDDLNVVYGGQEDQEALGNAIWKAFGETFIEGYTERVGDYFDPIIGFAKGVTKGVKAGKLSDFAEALVEVKPTATMQNIRRFKEKTLFNGTLSELMEEELGMAMNAFAVGDYTFDKEKADKEGKTYIFDHENQFVTAMSVGMFSAAINGTEMAANHAYKRKVNKTAEEKGKIAERELGAQFSEMIDGVPSLRERIDNADADEKNRILADIWGNPNLNDRQKAAVAQYAIYRQYAQTFNAVQANALNHKADEVKEQHAAYEAGYSSTLPAFYNIANAFKEAEQAISDYTEKTGDSSVADAIRLIENNPSEIKNVRDGLTDEQYQLVTNYINNLERYKGAYKGRSDKLEDYVDEYAFALEPAINADANGNRTITTAIYKGEPVYVLYNDGTHATIMKANGDRLQTDKQMLLTRDLSEIVSHDAEQYINGYRQQITGQYDAETENAFEHHPKTQSPQVGLQLQSPEGEVVITAINDNTVEIVPAVYKDGQVQPKEGSEPRTITVDDAYAWQDDYYLSMDADQAYANAMAEASNMSAETTESPSFEQGDELVFYVNGEPIDADITGIDPEGNYYVHVSNLVDGLDKAVSDVYTAEELRKLTTPSSKVSEKTTKNESTPTEQIKQSVSKEITNGQTEENASEPIAEVMESVNTPQTKAAELLAELEADEVDENIAYNTQKVIDLAEEKRKTKPTMKDADGDVATFKALKAQWQAELEDAQRNVLFWNNVAKEVANKRKAVIGEATHVADVEEVVEPMTIQPKRRANKVKREPVSFDGFGDAAMQIANDIMADKSPQNGTELAAAMLSGSGKRKIRLEPKSFRDHTGYSTREQGKLVGLFAADGVSMERMGELVMQADREDGTNFFDQNDANAGLNAVLEVLGQAETMADINQYITRNREEAAWREASAIQRYEDKQEQDVKDAWYMDQYHATEDELAAYNEYLAEFAEEIYGEDTDYEQRIATFAEIQLEEYDNQGTDAGLRSSADQGEGLASDREGGRSVGETEQLDRREVLADAAGVAEAEDGRAGGSVSAQSDDRQARIDRAVREYWDNVDNSPEAEEVAERDWQRYQENLTEDAAESVETLENGDVRRTNLDSNGEIATVAIERDGNVISVDTYEDGALFEHTDYDANGNATKVTRYKDGEVVSEQEYKDGKRKVTANYFEMAEEAQKNRKSKKDKDDTARRSVQESSTEADRVSGEIFGGESLGEGESVSARSDGGILEEGAGKKKRTAKARRQSDNRQEARDGKAERLSRGISAVQQQAIDEYTRANPWDANLTDDERGVLNMYRMATLNELDELAHKLADKINSGKATPRDRMRYDVLAAYAKSGELKAVADAMGVEYDSPVSLDTIKSLFETFNSDPELAVLFDRVFPLVKEINPTIVYRRFTENDLGEGEDISPDDILGQYTLQDNPIEYNRNQIDSNHCTEQEKASTIVREIIHAVARYAIRVQEAHNKGVELDIQLPKRLLDAAQSLIEVYDAIKDNEIFNDDRYESGKMYGVSSVHEMLSELANPEFREKLKQVSIENLPSDKRGIVRDALRAIKDFIHRMFGWDSSSAYARTKRALDKLIDNYDSAGYNKARELTDDDFAQQMRPSSEENLRFREKEEPKELIAVHNISEDNLKKVLEAGSLIMPSIAITKADMGYDSFGEISLLFDKSTINPSDRRNKVYGGDAWTPRFPRIGVKLNDKVVSRINKKAYELIDDRRLREIFSLSSEVYPDNIEKVISDYGVEGYYNKEWMKLAYLLDSGKKVKIPTKAKDYGIASEDIVRLAKEKGLSVKEIYEDYDFYKNNPDFVAQVKDARDEARLSSIPEEQRDEMRERMQSRPLSEAAFDSYVRGALEMENDLANGGLKEVVDRQALRDLIEKKVKTDNAEYNKWVDNLFEGIVEKRGIRNNRDWYTPSGDLRPWGQLYDPATPANILKYMLAENEQGGSGGFFDSNIMGASAETYGSIEEIREKGKKRLKQLPYEEYDEWSNSIADRMAKICDDFLSPSQKNSMGGAIDAKIEVTNAVAKDKTAKGIYKHMHREYPNFTMEHAKQVEEIVKEIQEFATGYFEAKPQRLVSVNEVMAAVVPSNASKEIVDALKSNGIEVVTYKKGDEEARKRVVKRVSSSMGIRFREGKEKSLETALQEDESSFKGTAVSSDDGAKVLKDIDNAISEYENKSTQTKNFIGDVARALGIDAEGKSSKYATFEAMNGDIVTIRISDHNATVSNFDNNGEENGVSIVVSRRPNEGITNDGDAHVVEFFYSDKKLKSSEDKPLVEILKSIKQTLYSGEYKDNTGLAEREEVNDRLREGMGAISDREVSYENDPIAKFQGKPRYYGKRAAAFAERERRRMENAAKEAAEMLGIEAEIVTDASTLQGRKAKAKGWYDIINKKVVVVVPNHVSMGDAVRTVLHEGIAHHGLRELFGDGFDAMLDNVYNNVDPELKARIDAIAERTGVSTSVATEEYLAGLAETTNFEEAQRRGWWAKIKQYFVNMLNKLGMPGLKLKEEITDNELRYLLWRSYQNLVEPNSYLKPLGYIDDVAKQKELKVGSYAEKKQTAPMAAEMSEAEEWAEVTMQRIEELEVQAAQLENEIAEMETKRDADDASRHDMWEGLMMPLRMQLEDVYAEIEGLYTLSGEEEVDEEEREAEKQRQLYQKRIDNAYLKAVREGDWEEATDLFRQYVLSKAEDEGVVPMDYGVGYRGGAHSSIAKKVKEENPDAIAEAAYQMSIRIPKGSILVPMPSRTGNATYTIKLAEAIAKATDSEVRDVLKGKARMSVYEAKQKGIKMTPEDLGMYTTEELPKGKNIVIIDNVIDKGTTALAAVSAVKGASVVAYAYTLGDKQRVATLKLAEPVTYDDNKRIIPLSQRFNKETDDIRYRLVDVPAEIERLENEPTIKAYRAMQVINGELYPPMSAVVDGKLREPIALGQWERSEERPDLADDNGRFKLDKGNKKSLKAAYNPYFYSSSTPLNDQFSEAQDRDNLVTVEVEVPVSEADGTSGYKAEKAKDAVGTHQWKAGIIQGQLTGTREVFLTRWDKPIRIVPESEVADVIVEMFDGKDIVMPSNVVTPQLRKELEARGITFVETDNQGKLVEGEHKGEHYSKVYGKKSTNKSKKKADSGLRYRAIGGNKGYVGYSMSKRAAQARDEGRFPKTDFKTEYGISDKVLDVLVKLGVVNNTEWHHTSKFGNKTTFYGWDEASYADYYEQHREEISKKVRTGNVDGLVDEFEAYEEEQERLRRERAANDMELMREYGKYREENAPTIPDEYNASNGVRVVTNGSSMHSDWKYYWGENEAFKKYARAAESELAGKLRAEDPRMSFTEWKAKRNSEEIISEVEREAAALGVPVRTARSVDELPDEDTRKRAEDGKLKGYYDTRTGEVVVYEPNTDNANDAKRTVLHEIVGHKGLRQLIGEERYDKAMVQLMYMLPSEARDAVLRRAERHGWNAAIAMDEYLAEQAERDVQPTWWGKVNAMIRALLRNMGFNVMLTDADVTYLLWRSRKKLQGDTAFDMATDAILKQAARKSAEAEAWNEQAFQDAEMRDFEHNALPSIRHRMGADVNDYEKDVRTLGFKQAEAWQDSMRSLLVFQAAIAKASGKDITDFENAYMYENRMSSANLMEMEQYRHMVYNPLLKEIHELEQMGASRESIINYLFAKSGLERNEVFARRDAKKHAEGDAAKEQQLYDKYRQKDYAGLTALTRGDAQISALVDDHSKKKTEHDRLEQNKKRGVAVSDADLKAAKKEMNDARKAMITAIEAEAQRMVDEFEAQHNTDNLWDKIRNCTHTTLNISHDAGVMSDEVYNELWNQFQYYIPLRGFAETTAEDVYLYLGGNDSPYNAPIKTAYGRTSLADDPIATIGNMAESAIVEANRNRLKQRFLYMVERHNTDLASISDVWLEYDDVNDEWHTVFAQIPDDATPSEAKRLQQEFEDRMKLLAEQNPGKYANASQQPNIPYRVVKKGDRQEHHVIVKRNGKDVVITINGNPRVAQAINGLTNPEQNQGMITRITSWINRNLSANFTMRNPAFMVSNFVRDGFYTNSMVWVKENPAYARQYNKNWAICTAQIASLVKRYKRYEKGDTSALDMNNDMDRMFYEFMINGGETGYTVIKSVEDYKGLISGEMKKMEAGAMGTARRVADTIGNVVDTFGRWAEDTSRFAAYMTSRQLGRTVTKSIWDAKEISVNFNKKGSGNRMMGKFEHGNRWNYLLSNMSQLGRNLYVFWNAGVQGLNNFSNAAKKSPAKFTAMAGTYFTLGVIVAAAFSGDDDEDDYYNLPEYVRRNNICFKIGKGKYATLPLPIEIRAIYGLGELAYSYLSGREGLTHGEAVTKTIQQITQVMPIDMMADGGGAMALVPSAAKPVVEVIHNVDWTGRPIYKEKTPWNQNDPTWTLAFKSTNPELVKMSRRVNEWTNKDTAEGLERPYNRGWADNRYLNNPAVWEHIAEGYLGGMATMFNQSVKSTMALWNEDLREVRNVPIVSRFVKDAGKEGRSYAARNEYYEAKNIMDSWRNEMSKAKKEVLDGSLTDQQRVNAAKLRSSLEQQYMEAAERWKVLDRQRKALEEAYKSDQSEENRQALDDVMMQMATLVGAYK